MRATSASSALGLVVALACSACGSAPMHVAALDELERVRATPLAQAGAEVAPEAFARAEQQRSFALAAYKAGDGTLAGIHADHAIAAYQHALVVVRLARAATEEADAQKALDAAATQLAALDGSRVDLDRDAAELEQRVQLARQRLLPAQSAQASGAREEGRLVVARAMIVEARLLCGAARLVSTDAPGLVEADAARAKLDALDSSSSPDRRVHPVPIDDAARARAGCLDALTRARRGRGDEGRADSLLSELSATGAWDPSRDERGVVVTLRGLFQGKELGDGWAAKLQELGRVAASHPTFGIQVVVHDADAPAKKDETDARRAEAAVKALVAGGAALERVDTELAGARAPVADPADRKLRARNDRLEIVFVPTAQ